MTYQVSSKTGVRHRVEAGMPDNDQALRMLKGVEKPTADCGKSFEPVNFYTPWTPVPRAACGRCFPEGWQYPGLLADYLAAKQECERLVAENAASPSPTRRGRVMSAQRQMDQMKASAGEGGPGDPLCCQRYSRLHHPVFSVQGCRWYEARGADGLTIAHMWIHIDGCPVWRGYSPGAPGQEAFEAGEEEFCARHDVADRCSCGGLLCECGEHYPAEFLTQLPHGN